MTGDNLVVTIYLAEPGAEGHKHEDAAEATPSSESSFTL